MQENCFCVFLAKRGQVTTLFVPNSEYVTCFSELPLTFFNCNIQTNLQFTPHVGLYGIPGPLYFAVKFAPIVEHIEATCKKCWLLNMTMTRLRFILGRPFQDGSWRWRQKPAQPRSVRTASKLPTTNGAAEAQKIPCERKFDKCLGFTMRSCV